jgi:hypothetical protein
VTSAVQSAGFLHVLPGRFRLRIPALKGDRKRAREVEEALGRSPLVTKVTASATTGSVLVQYGPGNADSIAEMIAMFLPGTDPAEIERLESLAVEALGRTTEERVESGAPRVDWHARVSEVLRGVNESVGSSTGGADLRIILPALLLALGAYRMTTTRMSVPQWYDFFWWCFNSFATLQGRK